MLGKSRLNSIMKIALIFILRFFSELFFGQNCKCENVPELNEIISCKKTIFKNGAKIYREFNCGSSCVIFKAKTIKKRL